MAKQTKATKQLEKEIAHDYDSYQGRLFRALVSNTPIDTGHAQKGWKDVKDMSKLIGTNKKAVIIRNDVPYIQRLDEGHSSQKPSGFVKQTINKTRKP
jgi:hypothetical protein